MVSKIDVALMLVYFVAIAIVGYLSRKGTEEDYLICGKKVGVWHNVATLCATKITASIIITYLAFVYIFGISAIWIFIGTSLGYILFMFFSLKLKREGDVYDYHSMADYFHQRYGVLTGKIFGIIIFLVIFLNFSIQLIGGGKILSTLTGVPFSLAVLVCTAVILFYILLGGYRAVVKTDVVQFLAIIILFLVLGIFLFSNFTYDASQWDLMSAGPKLIIPFLLIGILFPFSAPDLWQRALSSKSVNTLKRSFIFTTFIYVAFGLFLTLIAMIIKLKIPNIEPDSALIIGFSQLLPSGLLGMGLVALFAAIMSSADSFVFIAGGLLMHDVLFKERSRTVKNLRAGVLISMIFGTLLAIFIKSLVSLTYLLTGIFMVLSVIVIATWIKDVKKFTLNFGLLFGIIITLISIPFVGFEATLIIIGASSALTGIGIGAFIGCLIGFTK